MFRNILSDVDGTLFDAYPAIASAFQDTLRGLGKDAGTEKILALAKQSLSHCLSTLAAEYHSKEEGLGAVFDNRYPRITAADQPPFPGGRAVCEYILSAGRKNVIVTHRGLEGTTGPLKTH